MRINKLSASFGKLQNETMELHDGLNVIYAPNESGKSTWCAFILAMLYGVDSSERVRSGYLPDKLRYAPWSGAPMEGSMELSTDKSDITITRQTRTKNAPMREFSAVYTGSGVPVRELNGINAGEKLTGISKDVFRRSAFIAQGTVAVSGSPELEKRISAIVSTGEEQTSYSEVDNRLLAWQRKRRYNRKGYLPELEARMDSTQRQLEDMGGSLVDVELLEKRLEQTRADCTRLETMVTESRRRQRREALDRLNKGRSELKTRSDEHDTAMTALSQSREVLASSPFGNREPELVEDIVSTDLAEHRRLTELASSRPKPFMAVALLLLAVLAAALYTKFDQIPYMLAAVLLCVSSVVFLLRYGKARRSISEALLRADTILKKYSAASPNEIKAFLHDYKLLWEKAQEAETEEQRCRAEFENARTLQAGLEAAALNELDFASGDSEAARLGRELTNARLSAEKLSCQIAELNGRLATMGDPLVLKSSLSSMRDEYETICAEYDAISLAIDTLRDADDEMQSRFSPELGRVAAKYMATVTDGRYSDVLISRDFTAKTRTSDDTVAHEAEFLSAGTLDIMYLAVRLAVCELALPEGESCPLIIDDALVNLDEQRHAQVLLLLEEIAKDRQVILFSCRKQ